jgi:hypothetical protein
MIYNVIAAYEMGTARVVLKEKRYKKLQFMTPYVVEMVTHTGIKELHEYKHFLNAKSHYDKCLDYILHTGKGLI